MILRYAERICKVEIKLEIGAHPNPALYPFLGGFNSLLLWHPCAHLLVIVRVTQVLVSDPCNTRDLGSVEVPPCY